MVFKKNRGYTVALKIDVIHTGVIFGFRGQMLISKSVKSKSTKIVLPIVILLNRSI